MSSIEINKLERIEEVKMLPRTFPFPDIESFLYPVSKEFILDGRLIGAALLKITSEIILIQDMSVPVVTRAKALVKGVGVMDEELDKLGLDDTHVFVCGPNAEESAQFYIKNLGFVKAKGIPLFRSIYG